MIGLFFLYDLLYTSFSSFKTEYIYGKQYSALSKPIVIGQALIPMTF